MSYSGDLEAYRQVSLKLKLGVLEDEYIVKKNSISLRSKESSVDTDMAGLAKTGLQNPHCLCRVAFVFSVMLVFKYYSIFSIQAEFQSDCMFAVLLKILMN